MSSQSCADSASSHNEKIRQSDRYGCCSDHGLHEPGDSRSMGLIVVEVSTRPSRQWPREKAETVDPAVARGCREVPRMAANFISVLHAPFSFRQWWHAAVEGSSPDLGEEIHAHTTSSSGCEPGEAPSADSGITEHSRCWQCYLVSIIPPPTIEMRSTTLAHAHADDRAPKPAAWGGAHCQRLLAISAASESLLALRRPKHRTGSAGGAGADQAGKECAGPPRVRTGVLLDEVQRVMACLAEAADATSSWPQRRSHGE